LGRFGRRDDEEEAPRRGAERRIRRRAEQRNDIAAGFDQLRGVGSLDGNRSLNARHEHSAVSGRGQHRVPRPSSAVMPSLVCILPHFPNRDTLSSVFRDALFFSQTLFLTRHDK